VFRPVPWTGFYSAIFNRKRLQDCILYPTFLDMELSNNESMELQGVAVGPRILVANEDKHFGNLLKKPDQVLLTPGQYQLLGARIVVSFIGN
jgi:hypothetical protein